ncbi:MAG: 4-hydroxy-tetrahydrodipicolinate synthase family protein [Candidatus Brocadiia bacterium]
MELKRLQGAWTALVTPFAIDGDIAWDEFERLVEFQIDQGIDGLVPVGTTGESPTLEWRDHDQVIETTIRLSRGRCGVLAGTGSNSTAEALRGSKHAAEAGAHALLLVDCYYNGPSSLELRRHYHGAVAEACPKTLIVPYVIPGRSGTALAPEDLALLADAYPNVRSVKEATGDLERMAHTRALVGGDFDILSGDDNMTATMMLDEAVRADGVVSVMSNVVPASVAAMVRALAEGRSDEGLARAKALEPLFGIVTVTVDDPRSLRGQPLTVRDKFRNPAPVKTLMQGLGMIANGCRPPLGKMSPAGVEVVRAAAREVWSTSPEVLEPIAEAFDVDIEQRLADDALWASLAEPST